MVSLTSLQFGYIFMIDVSASLEISTLPESESFISDQTIHTFNGS